MPRDRRTGSEPLLSPTWSLPYIWPGCGMTRLTGAQGSVGPGWHAPRPGALHHRGVWPMKELRDASIRSLTATALAALTLGVPMAARAELPPLIPRDVLFGNPEKVSPKISPDGKRMAWIAPDQKNVRQVWVKTIGKDDDKVVTDDKKRGIRIYEWAENSKVLLYMQDNDGDEDFHVYGVDLDAGKVRDFTPHEKIQAR